MGSLGWIRCNWCWDWCHNPWLPDHCGQALCDDCLDRWFACQRPPWQPDNLSRMAKFFWLFYWVKSPHAQVRERLTHEISEHICSFLVRQVLP